MPLLNISEAARSVKKSRATIHNYLKNGTLSCVTNDKGNVKIDTSELLRVFGELTGNNVNLQAPGHINTPEIDTLQAQIHRLEKELDAAHEEKSRLLSIIEKQALALPQGEAKKGFWARAFGK
jgi:predicted site-specific integrase-resolvase